MLERTTRGGATYEAGRRHERMERIALAGWRRWAAFGACAVPILLGVVIPDADALGHGAGLGTGPDFPALFGLRDELPHPGSSVAAAVTVLAAIVVGSFQRLRPGALSDAAVYVGRLGYAVPGGVIAVGLFVPFAALDNTIDAWDARGVRGSRRACSSPAPSGSWSWPTWSGSWRPPWGPMNPARRGSARNLDAVSRVLGQSAGRHSPGASTCR